MAHAAGGDAFIAHLAITGSPRLPALGDTARYHHDKAALKAFATSPNQKTLILPVEATGVLGSLAGIAEIARESFKGEGEARPAPWGQRPG